MAAARLSTNGHLRQRLLKIGNPGVSDLRVAEDEYTKVLQTLEVLHAGVADLRGVEREPLQFFQTLEVLQPGVADLRAAERRAMTTPPIRNSKAASLRVTRSVCADRRRRISGLKRFELRLYWDKYWVLFFGRTIRGHHDKELQ